MVRTFIRLVPIYLVLGFQNLTLKYSLLRFI